MAYEVDFLSVGDGERSGDAICLRFGNLSAGREQQIVMVIDGGYLKSGEEMVDHIKKYYGTESVDIVVSTHPDADHAGGLTVVLERMRVGQLWLHRPWNHTLDIAKMFQDTRVSDKSVRESLRRSLEAARDLESIATRRQIPIVEPFSGVTDRTGRILVVGPSEKFYEGLLPGFRGTPVPVPAPGLLARAMRPVTDIINEIAESWNIETLTDDGQTSAENDSSAIILVRAGDEDYLLFTADAGIPALNGAIEHLTSRGFDFTKLRFVQVPHHGSHHNVGPAVLDRLIGPKLATKGHLRTAFVSVAKEAVKHPSKKVANAFKRRGATVHATQGLCKLHHQESRRGWTSSVPLPFYERVEE
jgi:beta-lactamase superfamily II metal-dependent hydrolase